MDANGASSTPLAIVGIGCLFPGASDFEAYWARIKDRTDAITDVPPTHWDAADYLDPDPRAPDRVYAARGGFLEAVPFPPAAFGIAPNNLEATDTSQLLGLIVARQALADAGLLDALPERRARTSVILGVTGTLELVIPLGARLGHPLWRRALREAGVEEEVADRVVRRIADGYVEWQENSFPGLLGNVVAGRIANRFDLGGTNCVVDAACASSLSAIHLASLELTAGRADVVVTGGVDTFNDVFMYACFSKTPALSATGSARPFDASADGTILGEGLGILVLKRLDDARRDGDRVYAILKGMGTSSDGKGNAVYAPRAEGQIAALRSAYAATGVTPDTIELVEAHGTGTRVGDATEAGALNQVYRATGREGTWCALGSVKSQIGHTKAAAGVAGIIKVAAALYHKVLPPTIKVDRPIEPLTPGASPLYINTEKRPWLPGTHPRRAAVSAFGFGGSNFHCVLEEADPGKAVIDWDGDVQLLAFASHTPADLAAQLAGWPADLPWGELRREAAALRERFSSSAPCRLVAVAERGRTDLANLLGNAHRLLESRGETSFRKLPEGIFLGIGPRSGELAVLFPGQGAQYPGMLRDLVCQFPAAFDTLADAERAFPALGEHIYPIPAFSEATRTAQAEALRDTAVAQPALGAVSLGAWRVLESFGVRAGAFAGHSYGELTALCAAGWMAPADFHRLSGLRGRLMAEARVGADPGSMLAVHAPVEAIAEVLRAEGIALTLANKNAPQQVVLSGATAEIERAERAFASRQVRATRLAVAAAFHTPFVAHAVEPLRRALAEVVLRPGNIPVFANSNGGPYPHDPEQARALLANQLARPVEWVAEVEALYARGARTFLEVGPGARLTGLVGGALAGRDHEALSLDASSGRRSGTFDLACTLAWLAARGYDLCLSSWDGEPRTTDPATNGKPTLTVSICGANYRRPRPSAPVPLPTGEREEDAKPQAAETALTHPEPSPTPSPAALMTNDHHPPREPAPPPDPGALGQALQVTRETLAWLQRLQEQAAQLHRQFLQGQESAQRTVHLLVEQQQRLLQASMGTPSAAPPTPPLPPPPPPPAFPTAFDAPAPLPAVIAPPPRPEPPAPPLARVSPPPLPPAPAPSASDERLRGVLLEVVSEKTGYPADMLEPGMALDADLGIDSIKRVEILSALQERLPDTPPVGPEHLGSLHTLQHVIDFLARAGAGGSETSAPPTNGAPPSPARPAPDERLRGVLLEVVSEKTGYPAEMLEPGMALDADLGIDSIKRVEILSALQERLPDTPPVGPEHLGSLHTLQHVIDFLARATADDGVLAGTETPRPFEPGGPEALADGPQLDRSVLRVAPLPTEPRPPVHLAPGAEVWVTADDPLLARALEQELHRRGFRPRLARCAELTALPRPTELGGLILVAPPGPTDAGGLRSALLALRHVAPGLRKAGGQRAAVCATVSRMDGCFGLQNLDPRREPLDGGLAGLAKTAGHEWPEVSCKALDLAGDLPAPEAARQITEEIFTAGPAEVGLRREGACTLQRLPIPLPPAAGLPFAPGDVIVLSGGARGVTAEVAVALAAACRPTLVLLGRTPEPQPEPAWLVPLTAEADIKRELAKRAPQGTALRWVADQYRQLTAWREVRHTLARIEAAGGKAHYRSVDVRDARAVSAVIEDVRRQLGPVRGLIHGAGVLADARIEDKTAEQFDRVFATKVDGLRALLTALPTEELRALVLFSSSTGRFGRTGQADYAIANEALNKLARAAARRLPHCRVLSLNWGPWDGGMVTPALKELFAREGIGVIDLQAGARHVVRELATLPGEEVEVVLLAPGSAPEPPPQPSPPGGRPGLPLAFERVVDRDEVPVLADHMLDGRPVLPMALMLEWLAQGAMHENPGLWLHGLDELRLLHGVIVGDGPITLRVAAGKAAKEGGLYRVPVEMGSTRADGKEVLHARAHVLLAANLPPPPAARPASALAPYTHSIEEVYADLLFHGPQMQGIERIEGCGPEGIRARSRGAPPPAAWMRQPLRSYWLTDPLAVDVAFQVLILWSRDRRGAPGLPCGVARYRQYRRAFPPEGVRIDARVTRSTDLHLIADLDFRDAAGQVIARMEGCEVATTPGLERAYAHEKVTRPV